MVKDSLNPPFFDDQDEKNFIVNAIWGTCLSLGSILFAERGNWDQLCWYFLFRWGVLRLHCVSKG